MSAHDWNRQMDIGRHLYVINTHRLTEPKLWHDTKSNLHRHIHTMSLTVDRASSSLPVFSPFPLIRVSVWHLPFSHLIFSNSSRLLSALLPAKSPPPIPLPSLCHVCSLPSSLPFCLLFAGPTFAPAIILAGFIRGWRTKDWEGTISGYYRRLLSPYPSHRHTYARLIYISGI